MNKNWENWEKENQQEVKANRLRNTKSGSISYLENQGKHVSRKEIFHAHWETYLTSSSYWKNWREKINSFKTEKEISFYTDRLRAFIDFVEKHTCKDKNNYCGTDFGDGLQQWDPNNTPKMIEQELARLENISQEEFNKTDQWKKAGPVFKELSAKEMLNDPWFSKQIDNIFGLENGKLPDEEEKPVEKNKDSNVDYHNWTYSQLIAEINRLKAENQQLKNNQTLTDSERQEGLQQNQQQLEKIESIFNSEDTQQQPTNNNFPTGLIVGGAVLLLTAGLALFLVIKSRKVLKDEVKIKKKGA